MEVNDSKGTLPFDAWCRIVKPVWLKNLVRPQARSSWMLNRSWPIVQAWFSTGRNCWKANQSLFIMTGSEIALKRSFSQWLLNGFPTTILGNDLGGCGVPIPALESDINELGLRMDKSCPSLGLWWCRDGLKDGVCYKKFHLVRGFENCFENIGHYLFDNFNNGTCVIFSLNTATGALPGYILQKGCLCHR